MRSDTDIEEPGLGHRMCHICNVDYSSYTARYATHPAHVHPLHILPHPEADHINILQLVVQCFHGCAALYTECRMFDAGTVL